MSGKNFIVLKASAGSGKTYALVRYFLLLALRSDYPRYYRHILAITFTNAAAAEMKQRVLDRLKDLATDGHTSDLANDLLTTLGIPAEQLQSRASATYRDMLHHYSQISILTIDSFTHRIIRSFARDLHLSHDFNIEIDSSLFLEKLVDQCLDNIGNDADLTSYLVEYARENADEGENWRLREGLIKTSRLILEDSTKEVLAKLPLKSLADFTEIRKKILHDCLSFENTLKKLAEPALKQVQNLEISQSNFAFGGNGTISVLSKIVDGNFKQMPGSRFQNLTPDSKWHAAKATAEAIEKIMSISESLTSIIQDINAFYTEVNHERYKLRRNILKHLHAIGLLETLTEYANRLREEENTILIADFQRIINDVVRDNDAPFIYERTGNRYKHILFDEFQDTSLMQWSNTIPLIINTLSENNLSLIVGDAKQSIYRWRGGDVAQLVQLPEIPEKAAQPEAADIFRQHIQVDHLSYNRRSSRQIVAFNNTFFRQLSESLTLHKNVYEDVKQKTIRDLEGYVKVVKSDSRDATERWEKTSGYIIEFIRECLDDGYRPGDIAVLTRKGNKEAGKIASWLMGQGYQVVTRDSFLLQNSAVVRITMGFLEYMSNPDKQFAAIDLVQSLELLNPDISTHNFLKKYSRRAHREIHIDLFSFLHDHFGAEPSFTHTSNIYQQAIDILSYFKLEADTGMEFLLEKIRLLCIGRNYSLSEFIDWWSDSKETLCTSATENENAINILTVHKSKGLQYPVVIYARLSTTTLSQEVWVDLDPALYHVPTAYVTAVKNDNEDSEWPEAFFEEKENGLLDEMNICYVANTRAEDRFYLIQEKGIQSTELSKNILSTLDNMSADFAATGQMFLGKREKYLHRTKEQKSEVIRFRVTKSTGSSLKFIPVASPLSEEREYGNLLHQSLGYIHSPADAEKAVVRACALVSMTDEKIIQQLQDDVQKLISNHNTAHWFSGEIPIIAEREICTTDGQIIRPDRVIAGHQLVEVIDFKTGDTKKEHEEQVLLYVKHLQEIYNLPVKGFLYYTTSEMLKEVSA